MYSERRENPFTETAVPWGNQSELLAGLPRGPREGFML